MTILMSASFLSGCSTSSTGSFTKATLPTSTAILDSRPTVCPKIVADPNQGSGPSSELGIFPWPKAPSSNYTLKWNRQAHTTDSFPPIRPSNWNISGGSWKLTSARSSNSQINTNPQELCGVKGNSVDLAWQKTTGSPETVIAVLDSGIEFCDPALVDKIYLNQNALPLPENAQGLTKPELIKEGVKFIDSNPYDLNNSGIFNIQQYAQDPRIPKVTFCATHKGGGYSYAGISPADLIDTFGTPGSPYYINKSGPAGFEDAISGWNFLNDNNNPYDSVHYDHGTGEAEDSAGAAGTLDKEVGACPNCMILPVRVGDSFIASGNAFGEGVLFAVDSGASMIQEALGTYNVTQTDTQAVSYANDHGVPIIASAADEEAEHYNLPAALQHTIVVNSVTHASSFNPPSYLYLNGCTNYGGNIDVSVESASCSSEATGKASGIVGLAISAANMAVSKGIIKDYPGLKSATGNPVALSANEIKQIVTMTANDIDFKEGAAGYPSDNYSVKTDLPLVSTSRYPTTPGFDSYTGYGRINAANIVDNILAGRIPPQAEITNLSWFRTYGLNQQVNVKGLVGSPRGGTWKYELQIGAGVNPTQSQFYTVGSGSGSGVFSGTLGTVNIDQVAKLFPPGTNFSTLIGTGFTKGPDKLAFTVRLVVQSNNNLVGMARRTEYIYNDPTMLSGFPISYKSSIVAPVKFAPIGPGNSEVMLVASSSGTIRAIQQNGKELPNWPVRTDVDIGYHKGEKAYTSHSVTAIPHGEIIGGVAVGDLSNKNGSSMDIVVTDLTGRVYAFNQFGKLLPNWPVRTDPNYSLPSITNRENRLLPGIFGAPVLADLTGSNKLDVIAASMDRHVYAWSPRGSALPGWPVLVVDRSEVSSINPITNQVTFNNSADALMGTKLMDSPAVAQLIPNEPPEVIVGSNEQYQTSSNANLGTLNLLLAATGNAGRVATSRIYAIYADGNNHTFSTSSPTGGSALTSDPFLPNWPVAITDIEPSVLPDIGDGISESPAVANFKGQPIVAVMSDVGPLYLLNSAGQSVLGYTSSMYNVLSSYPPGKLSPDSSSLLSLSIPALGAPSFSYMNGKLVVAAPAISAGKALDLAEPANQTPHNSQVDVWSVDTGNFIPGFPENMDDIQFFDQPTFAGFKAGKSFNSYVLEPSAYGDLRAFDFSGKSLKSFPKFTGGWVTGSPSIGSFSAKSSRSIIAIANREGELMAWELPAGVCEIAGNSVQSRADLYNDNYFGTNFGTNAQIDNAKNTTCP